MLTTERMDRRGFRNEEMNRARQEIQGKWSEADIIKAVRTGERPDGRVLAPVMPYHSYGRLTDADARALVSYLKSLKPVRHQAPKMIGDTEKPTAPYFTVVLPD